MPQFNIYKIPKTSVNDLKKELDKLAYLENTITLKGFKIDFYLHFDENEMWWINYYGSWISKQRIDNPNDNLQNKSYYGAVVLTKGDMCYAISLGKTHFYIKRFCQYDFGIQFAQRVVNSKNVTLLNSNSFGGNKRKSINSFSTNSSLEPESGEAIMSLKGGTLNEEYLGAFISCGDSISISLEEYDLIKLPELIEFVETSLKQKSLFDIPTSRKENDPNICKKLDAELVQKILEYSNEVNFSEIIHTDSVGFLTRGDYFIKYLVCNRNQIDINGSLYFDNIKNKFAEKGIEYTKENILNLKVKVQNQFGEETLKPIKYFLDYVNPEKYYLNEGIWHHFNQKYIEFINNSVDLIKLKPKPEFDKSYEDYQKWVVANKIDKKEWYFERYFNEHIMTDYGFKNTDRQVNLSDDDEFRRYKLEIADSVNDDLLAFVKKGTPQKLNYVIDQSLISFKYLQEKNWQFELEGKQVRVRKMCLVLLFERQKFNKITEVESLIFKMKLNEWRKKLIGSNIEPIIWCSFLPKKLSESKAPKTKRRKE